MIDLHCHSTFSDGLHTPEELLSKACTAQLRMLALTDHDTFEGSQQLVAMANDSPVTVIPGIELSTRWKKHDIHILGYNIDFNCANLQSLIQKQQESRLYRAQQIAAKLEKIGVGDAFAKAVALAGHQQVGRPHFAQLLVNEHKVRDKEEAFSRYLSRGKSAYIPTQWISVSDAIGGITGAKGSAVLAHPLKYSLSAMKLRELLTEFKEAGGCGLEIISGEMQRPAIQQLVALSLRFDLLSSTGSDFHGEGRSRLGLGRQYALPESCKPIWQHWVR